MTWEPECVWMVLHRLFALRTGVHMDVHVETLQFIKFSHATVSQSNPFEFLECLGQFGSHNPLVLAFLGLWGVIIPVRQRAPPMRLAVRTWTGSVMQPLGDTVSQCAILGVDSSIGDITKFLC